VYCRKSKKKIIGSRIDASSAILTFLRLYREYDAANYNAFFMQSQDGNTAKRRLHIRGARVLKGLIRKI